MKKEQIALLFQKYLRQETNSTEGAWLESWYLQEGTKAPIPAPILDYHHQEQKIWIKIQRKVQVSRRLKIQRIGIKIAASVILVLSAGVIFYFNEKSGQTLPEIVARQNKIITSSEKVMLELENGETISLKDKKTGIVIRSNQVTYNDGTRINALSKTKQLILSVPKGVIYTATLPDGTKVTLNASTTLKFPSTFINAKYRQVELSGEAFFTVAKDSKHPFIVKTSQQEVEVLGTQFNINNVPDERKITTTTLVEGSVKISTTTNTAKILKPGQQSVVEKSTVKISAANLQHNLAWKNGYFSFDRASIHEVMNVLSNWYTIEVYYGDNITSDKFSGEFSRSRNIGEVLEKLEKTGLVHFKIEGRRITITE